MNSQLPECTTLLLRRSQSTLFMTLNRPHVRNAINGQMWDEIDQVFTTIENDRSIKVVVIRGAGGSFCAGGDISERSTLRDQNSEGDDPVAIRNRRAGKFLSRINKSPQAVIAFVEGHALGGGFGLACVSDITIATADASFGLPEVTLGLVPAQIIPFLRQRIGSSQLRRITLTATRINATEALKIGIIHELYDNHLEAEARLESLLQELDRAGPIAISQAKALIEMAETLTEENLLDHAAQVIARLVRSPEGVEGALAFKEKRATNWKVSRN